jgi:hydrogenase expression/formation protein HypD
LQSIFMLVRQVNDNTPQVEIQYSRAVSKRGNMLAKQHLLQVFETSDDRWRGFGVIQGSGLKLRKEFEKHNIEVMLPLNIKLPEENASCICGDILRGFKAPGDCALFGRKCVPEDPSGACMVSSEGTCNSWYRYRMNE